MFRTVATLALLGSALAILIPSTTVAQEQPATPEGSAWNLVEYAGNGELIAVPWYVDATLVLEGGDARGSAGCNAFDTSYQLDGDVLTFGAASTTDVGCEQPWLDVEAGYTAALPLVSSWALDSGPTDVSLHLRDEQADTILTFQRSVASLTRADVYALTAELESQRSAIEDLARRLDDTRISTLRDRVKALEAQVKALEAARPSAPKSGAGSVFSAAERTLLKGIPANVRRSCRPLRGSNPSGTLAAVACSPAASAVSELAYYLMPYADARRTFTRIMSDNGVPQATACPEGIDSRGAACAIERRRLLRRGRQRQCPPDRDGGRLPPAQRGGQTRGAAGISLWPSRAAATASPPCSGGPRVLRAPR